MELSIRYLKACLILAALLLPSLGVLAQYEDDKGAGERDAYRVLAEKIFYGMRLSETDKSARLAEATVDYLVALEKILAERQETLDALEAAAGDGKPADEQVVEAYEVAKSAYLPLRRAYVDTLEEDLVPYHVERVKDGLTHDALPNLHAMYLEMVPDLAPGEKAHILALLVEARENAMLAISAEGQKQWLDKYRGIINNYIAAQGYDFRTLSQAWDRANPEPQR